MIYMRHRPPEYSVPEPSDLYQGSQDASSFRRVAFGLSINSRSLDSPRPSLPRTFYHHVYNGLGIIFKLLTGVLLSEDLESFGISDGAGNDMGVGLDSKQYVSRSHCSSPHHRHHPPASVSNTCLSPAGPRESQSYLRSPRANGQIKALTDRGRDLDLDSGDDSVVLSRYFVIHPFYISITNMACGLLTPLRACVLRNKIIHSHHFSLFPLMRGTHVD
jgi:hypothetical protein